MKARENTKNTATARKMEAITRKAEEIRKNQGLEAAKDYYKKQAKEYDELSQKHKEEVANERRRLETKPFDEFYKANARKYGFIYKFEPK